jgi:single-strand DNA-binding protein
VGIQGELRQDRWQQDGQNRSRVEIVANNIQLLGGGPQGGGGPPPQGGSGNYGGAGPAYGTSTPAPAYNGGPSYGGGGVPYQGGRGAGRASPPAEDDHSYDDVPF